MMSRRVQQLFDLSTRRFARSSQRRADFTANVAGYLQRSFQSADAVSLSHGARQRRQLFLQRSRASDFTGLHRTINTETNLRRATTDGENSTARRGLQGFTP